MGVIANTIVSQIKNLAGRLRYRLQMRWLVCLKRRILEHYLENYRKEFALSMTRRLTAFLLR